MTAQYSDIVSDGGMDPRNQFDNKHPSLAIVATGIPATIEDYQVALNAAFAGGIAYGKASASTQPVRPACFADWQDSHATDRGCGNCNLRYECRTGEPEQEPVAWTVRRYYDDGTPHPCISLEWAGRNAEDDFPIGTKFFTAPPQRKPLTDEQERRAFLDWCFSAGLMAESHGLRSESSDCETAWKAWQARAARGIKEQP